MGDKKAPDPTDKHVGSRVRMRRMMLGLSQEKLADGLGLTFQQVQKYEKGTNRIGASRLQQIAGILQVTVSFFFDGAPSPARRGTSPSVDDASAFLTDFFALRGAKALAEAYVAIPDQFDRNALIDVATAIANGHRALANARPRK